MWRFLLLLGLIFSPLACSSGPTAPPAPPPPPPPVPVATVTVEPGTSTLYPVQTVQLAATTKDANGNTLNGRSVTWGSSSTPVATVSTSGLVTAVAPGVATITATSENRSGTAQVTVLAPVSTVEVTPAADTLLVGAATTLSVTLKDAANNVLTNRPITWSTSNATIATVDATGRVTAVAVGIASIVATSEGKSGSAVITVLAPITSVTINGATNTKVGDSYAYTATARIADGTAVVRPVTWSIVETAKGTMSPNGVLVPQQIGLITVRVTIDGVGWVATITAYDWEDLSAAGHLIVGLRSDGTITNKFGTSERPRLLIACTPGGFLFVWVSTDNFVTHNGLVGYFFDDGPIFTQTWDELAPSYNSLWHPGATNFERRGFAALLAAARGFGFGFTEFNASAKAMLFRVTGLSTPLAPINAACPSNSFVAGADVAQRDIRALQSTAQARAFASAESALRHRIGPQPSGAPSVMSVRNAGVESQAAVRRPSP